MGKMTETKTPLFIELDVNIAKASWETQNDLGRAHAAEVLSYVHESQDLPYFVEVCSKMSRCEADLRGVKTGFFTAIGIATF